MIQQNYSEGQTGLMTLRHTATIAIDAADADTAESIKRAIRERTEAFVDDLKPKGAVARFLVGRAALISVRLDQAARRDVVAVAERVRRAGSVHDEARRAEVDFLMQYIVADPVTHARRLEMSVEGLDRMIDTLQMLRDDLFRPEKVRWTGTQLGIANALTGRRSYDYPKSPLDDLFEILVGRDTKRFVEAYPEIAGLTETNQVSWAAHKIAEILDAQTARLVDLRSKVDRTSVAIERAEAADRALVDTSRAGIEARKQEAALERTFFKTIDKIEAIARQQAKGEKPAARPRPTPPSEGPASLPFPAPQVAPAEAGHADEIDAEVDAEFGVAYDPELDDPARALMEFPGEVGPGSRGPNRRV